MTADCRALASLLSHKSAAPFSVDPRAAVPEGRVIVCHHGGEVWWRSAASEDRRHQRNVDFLDRLVGTLQLFFQLGERRKRRHEWCAWVSIEDAPFLASELEAGVALTSHTRQGDNLTSNTFLWPEVSVPLHW